MATLRLIPASGSPIEITREESLLGRDPSCDVMVADGSVSRKHARIEHRAGAWIVTDQGSANGTFLDSQKIGEATVRHGQELRFGRWPSRSRSRARRTSGRRSPTCRCSTTRPR